MDRIDQIKIFVHVVDAGGFAAAARELGLSRSVVSKAIQRLETSLAASLLTRSTRNVTVTENGLAFYDRCKTLLATYDETIGSVTANDDRPRGRLRINAPMSFGTIELSEHVADYMQRYPEVEIELTLNDRFVDPIEEGFDLTIRIAAPSHSTSLVHKPLAEIERFVCAAPGYLERHGTPSRPSQLRQHRCLHYGNQSSGSQWRLGNQSYAIRCVMWSNNGESLLKAAIAGAGIILLPDFIVGDAIKQGQLSLLLPEAPPPPLSVTMLYPRHKHLSIKLQRFIELLHQRYTQA